MSDVTSPQNMNFNKFFYEDALCNLKECPITNSVDTHVALRYRNNCPPGYSFVNGRQENSYFLMYRVDNLSKPYQVTKVELTPECLVLILGRIQSFAPVNHILKTRQSQQQLPGTSGHFTPQAPKKSVPNVANRANPTASNVQGTERKPDLPCSSPSGDGQGSLGSPGDQS